MADNMNRHYTNNLQNRIHSCAFVIAIVLSVLCASLFLASKYYFTDPVDQTMLESQINPNNASQVVLALLPGIGTTRANAIISYRKNFTGQGQGPNNRPFEKPQDLQKIHGIGPKTVQQISPWLKFQ